MSKHPLAMNGEVNVLVRVTSSLLTTPIALATKPLMREALPMIEDSSEDDKPAVLAADTRWDSKHEKRIEVERPPRTLPARRMGSEPKSVQTQAAV